MGLTVARLVPAVTTYTSAVPRLEAALITRRLTLPEGGAELLSPRSIEPEFVDRTEFSFPELTLVPEAST